MKFIEGRWSDYYRYSEENVVDVHYYPKGNHVNQAINIWIGDTQIAPTFRGFRTVDEWKRFVKAIVTADRELDEVLKTQ